MQFWLKMYIFTHASVFNVVLSLKLLLMGHILWALIPASDLYIWQVWAEREKGQQWGQRKEKQAVRFVRADECVSWELQGDQRWSPTEDLISETMEQQDTQHQPGWRRCWTARPRCLLLTAARKSLSKWFTEGVCSLQCQKSCKTIFISFLKREIKRFSDFSLSVPQSKNNVWSPIEYIHILQSVYKVRNHCSKRSKYVLINSVLLGQSQDDCKYKQNWSALPDLCAFLCKRWSVCSSVLAKLCK